MTVSPERFVPRAAWAEEGPSVSYRTVNAAMRPIGPVAIPLGGRELTLRDGACSGPDGTHLALYCDGQPLGLHLEIPEDLVRRLRAAALPDLRTEGAAGVALALELLLEGRLTELEGGRLGSLELRPSPVGELGAGTLRRTFDLVDGHATHSVVVRFHRGAAPIVAEIVEELPRPGSGGGTLRLALAIGRMQLPAPQLGRLKPGALLLPAPHRIAATHGILRIGRRAVDIVIEDGTAKLEDEIMSDDPNAQPAPVAVDAAPIGAAAPFDIEFLIPTKPMPLREICDLGTGAVVPLDTGIDNPHVEIRVGGARWGTGEIVAIGSRLAIQITERVDGH